MKKKYTFLVLLYTSAAFSQSFSEVKKIVNSDRVAGDYFGKAVSVSGNYAIIGAPQQGSDENGGNVLAQSGAAYFYERDNSGNWVAKQKVIASDAARGVGDNFGSAVCISGDYAVVGALYNDLDPLVANTNYGAAYVFKRNPNGIWIQQQKLVASIRAIDYFGASVSISGNYIIIGAYKSDEDATGINAMNDAGAAYVFERNTSNDTWSQVIKLVASDRAANDWFGWSVSISGDRAIVGAFFEDEDAGGINTKSNAGSAYIFERNNLGSWAQVQKIVASDRASDDAFSGAVSISGDMAVVGAYLEDEDAAGSNTKSNPGSAYIFKRSNLGVWSQSDKIVAGDRSDGDAFARSVCISGTMLIVGAYTEDEDAAAANTLNNAGSAYIFKQGAGGAWTQLQKVVASDRADSDWYAFGVSISGSTAIVGSHFQDKDAAGLNLKTDAGAAYFYYSCTIPAAPANATLASSLTICKGTSSNLIASGGGTIGWYSLPSGGTYLGGGNSFTTSALNSNSTFYAQDSTCASSAVRTAIAITINQLPSVSFALPSTMDTVCNTATSITLSGGAPLAGVYSGTGVTAGKFSPSAAGLGDHVITYSFVDANQCSNEATQLIRVEVCEVINNISSHEKGNMTLYPNPSDGDFEIRSNEVEDIVIINSIGQNVYSGKLSPENNYQLNIAGLENGVYIVRSSNQTKKIVVN